MKKRRFTPSQIAGIPKEFDLGKSTAEMSREYGIGQAAFYKWRQRYGGIELEFDQLVQQLIKNPDLTSV